MTPNVIAHHSLTNAQPVPKQWNTIPMAIPQFVQHDAT